jgi:hypothetical protein
VAWTGLLQAVPRVRASFLSRAGAGELLPSSSWSSWAREKQRVSVGLERESRQRENGGEARSKTATERREDKGLLLRSGEKRASSGSVWGVSGVVVVWSGRKEAKAGGGCRLNTPGAVHGKLGLERGRGSGCPASALAGAAMWTRSTAWAVVLDVCQRRLARARFWPERHPAGARPWSGGSGRHGVEVKGGQREGVHAPSGSWTPPLPMRVNWSDAERAWSRGQRRVRGDVGIAGWGSISGSGALVG